MRFLLILAGALLACGCVPRIPRIPRIPVKPTSTLPKALPKSPTFTPTRELGNAPPRLQADFPRPAGAAKAKNQWDAPDLPLDNFAGGDQKDEDRENRKPAKSAKPR